MPLGLALKNRSAIVVAADHSTNTAAATPIISEKVLPQILPNSSAAAVAQYVQAAMVLQIVPELPKTTGRIEIIVAGIDPIRHTVEPNIYYLDSARDFYLTIAGLSGASAGATAGVSHLVANRDFTDTSTDELVSLAKDCFTTTKLRWPSAITPPIQIGVITTESLTMHQYQ
jgi:hypothetical protein